MSSNAHDIVHQAARSAKWSALMEIVSRTATPLITVVLARFLTPADFGIVATAMVVISFGQMIWDAGLSKALIQTKEDSVNAAHVVFWTNLALGAIIYVLLFISAPWVAIFFKSPTSSSVLRVLGIQILIGSLTSVQTSLFIRDLDFRRLMWVKMLTASVPAIFSIPMAMIGYGVWALVAGMLTGQILNLILLWSHSTWRPGFRYDFALARKLMRFGCWILLESVAGWLQVWGDNLIVGRFLGVVDLGIYRLGWTMTHIAFSIILGPLLRVAYPAFSRLQDDRDGFLRSFHKSNRLLMAFAIPMGVGLVFLGHDLALALFGEKWLGLGFVLRVIGAMFAVAWMTSLNSELYRAMGYPHASAILTMIQIGYYLPAYYFAAQRGFVVFVYVRLAVACVALPMHVYLCRRMMGVKWMYLWMDGKAFALAAAVMAVVLLAVKSLVAVVASRALPWVTLALAIPMGGAAYVLTLWMVDRPFIMQIKSLVRRAAAV